MALSVPDFHRGRHHPGAASETGPRVRFVTTLIEAGDKDALVERSVDSFIEKHPGFHCFVSHMSGESWPTSYGASHDVLQAAHGRG